MTDESSSADANERIVWHWTFTRRQFLLTAAGGAAALGIAAAAGYEWPHAPVPLPENELERVQGIQSFVSRPDLHPPALRITHHRAATKTLGATPSPRFIFTAPRNSVVTDGQDGLMVSDRDGRLVWFKPVLSQSPFDLNAQIYRGRLSLTWWQGAVVSAHGEGIGQLADASYRTVQPISAGDGLVTDLHELQLTAAGTALVTAYELTSADLRKQGGVQSGAVYNCHAQEVDLATGKVLFDWNSLDHVGIEESYVRAPRSAKDPYDYFHINAISETPDGNLLITARNTWAVYKVDRATGDVVWRLNGKRSDFSIGKGANFYWQHDARLHEPNLLTIFDDGSTPEEEQQSRALLLELDLDHRRVELRQAYLHPGLIAADQGSVQLLDDGRIFVGWGNQPYFSEFAPDGTMLTDGEFPIGVRSYRAYTHDWTGHPTEPPALAVESNPAGGSLAYVSWNGATEVDNWSILSGARASALELAGAQEWSGFETAIAVNANGPYFQAIANDDNGRELGRSTVIRA